MDRHKTRLTFNKRLILSVLADYLDDCPPPHSAGNIHRSLEDALSYGWLGIYSEMKTLPSPNQIRRTLRGLAKEGLIVGEQFLNEPCGKQVLPCWEWRWQLATDAEKNSIKEACQKAHRTAKVAKHGNNFFGAIFDLGLPVKEAKELATTVRSLMQKTHPDKAQGLEEEFLLMRQAHEWIKSGIPLPTKRANS